MPSFLEHLTAADLRTMAGAIVLAWIVAKWLTRYLPDWRWTSLAVLGGTVVLLLAISAATAGLFVPAAQWADVCVLGLFGATIETFGYEALTNVLGLIGRGGGGRGG
ncbi:MAG: hypothetical protein ACYC4R_05360, partial [Anaerolineae bacterium]